MSVSFGIVVHHSLSDPTRSALAGAATTASPARAALPDVWAFAYLDNPAPGAGWVMDPARQSGTYRTTCGGIAVARESSTGIYEVTFPCSAAPSLGIVHVTTVDDTGHYCTAGSWGHSSAAVRVTVFCFDRTGAPARSRFTLLYTTSSGIVPGYHAYVYSDYTGATLASYNSTGAANPIAHLGTGFYQVTLPGLSWWKYAGNLQVTAVHPNQTAARCKVANWGWVASAYVATVMCLDRANRPADTWWTLSFHNLGSVYGMSWPSRFGYLWYDGTSPTVNVNSLGTVNSVTPAGPGQYVLTFPDAGVAPSHLQVATFGGGPAYCQLSRRWEHVASDLVAQTVICFDGVGGVVNSGFFATAAHTP